VEAILGKRVIKSVGKKEIVVKKMVENTSTIKRKDEKLKTKRAECY
jgi:hypothetical protein